MIEKDEILELSKALDLSADTVEKDYVLGWMLFGISQHSNTKSWAFKGGTSLKKCFFETFRFSEDLDYTLSDNSQLNSELLKSIFGEIADIIYEEIGIEFFKENFKFKIMPKENGKLSAHGKVHYNDPLRRKKGMMTIKLDLTTDEILVLGPVQKRVHHPYSDEPKEGIYATCYAFEEIVAEKVRALAQRARPRDLYDVVHFFRNRNLISNTQLVFNTLQKKCSYKGIETPTFKHIEEHEKLEELGPQWVHMLDHQLPHLPPMESFWSDLEPFFDWLYGELETEKLVGTSSKDGSIFQPGRIKNVYDFDAVLQKIQFAAANRVCVKIIYKGEARTVEPLSFRRAQNGNRLFYGFTRERNAMRSYSLSNIRNVEITNIPFTERNYPVEISSSGSVSMPPIRRKTREHTDSGFSTPQSRRSLSGPKYRYECHAKHGIYQGYE